MKTINTLLGILISLALISCELQSNKAGIYKETENKSEPAVQETNKIEVTSKIIEPKPDFSVMPSYCNPNSYKIVKIPKGFIIQLSGGTIISYPIYNTPEETQKAINYRAAQSRKRWIDSGGLSF